MATELNKFGINIAGSTTVSIGRTSTVAEDGVAGLAMRASVSCSFLTMANDSSANMNGPSGTNVSGSQESQLQVTGYNGSDIMLEIQNGNLDSGVVKLKVRQTEDAKTIRIADSSASDIYISGGGAHVLDGTGGVGITTNSALFIGLNGEEAGTSLDVSSSNCSIRAGQGISFYNGGQLFARAATLYAGTDSSDPWAGEQSSRYGIGLFDGDIGGTTTSNAPTGTWYVSSLRCTTSGNILRLTSGVCHITGKNTSANRFFELTDGNIYHSNGTISIETPVSAYIQWDAASTDQDNGPYNLIINHASNTTTLRRAIEILNNFTITAGTFNTLYHPTHNQLDVTGKLSVAGTLTGNASAITTGNVRLDNNSTITHAGTWTVTGPNDSGWLWYNLDANSSNWNPSAGTVHFSHASNLSGQHIQESKFFNLTLTAGASGHDVAWRDSHSNLLTIANDLTIEEGQLKRNDASDTLTVTEDVSVESGGILGRLEATGANNFGSLTIESGGTYNATSGTTTVTSEVGTKCWDNQTGGNFIHNNGKVSFDSSIGDTTFDNAGADPFYDLEVKTNGDCKYLNAITVENELTMNHSNLSFGSWTDASGAITVLGTTRLVDGLGFSGGIDNLNDDYYGFLIVEGGNFRTPEGANAKRCRGIKQTGGTIT